MHASNTPISRPARAPSGIKIHADFNGLLWSNELGFLYAPVGEQLPIEPPPDWQLTLLRGTR